MEDIREDIREVITILNEDEWIKEYISTSLEEYCDEIVSEWNDHTDTMRKYEPEIEVTKIEDIIITKWETIGDRTKPLEYEITLEDKSRHTAKAVNGTLVLK